MKKRPKYKKRQVILWLISLIVVLSMIFFTILSVLPEPAPPTLTPPVFIPTKTPPPTVIPASSSPGPTPLPAPPTPEPDSSP